MKKTVTLPDGTVEVLEGTPEEIAVHEKLIRERIVKEQRKKPDVLRGAPEPVPVDPELVKKLEELIEATKQNRPPIPFPHPVTPWWDRVDLAPICWICGKRGCQQLHQDPWPSPTVIYGSYTVTTDNTLQPDGQAFIPELHGGLIVR